MTFNRLDSDGSTVTTEATTRSVRGERKENKKGKVMTCHAPMIHLNGNGRQKDMGLVKVVNTTGTYPII